MTKTSANDRLLGQTKLGRVRAAAREAPPRQEVQRRGHRGAKGRAREERTIGQLVGLVRHRYRHALTRATLPHGLTAPQVSVLLALAESDGDVPTAIAARAHMDPPMVTRLLDRLETAGLLVRERDGRDRRRVRVHLSRRGWALLPSLRPIEDKLGARLLAGLGAEEQAALRALLERLCDNLGEGE